MINFEYFTPTKVFFGKDAQDKVGHELSIRGYKKILIHYGCSSAIKSGLLDKIVNNLKQCGIEYILKGGVEPNPKIGLIRESILLAKEENVDFILAVGGGSVIDSAKSISIGLATGLDPWDIIVNKIEKNKKFPIGVVLTISASGSEMSNSHVITNPNGNLKRGFNTDNIRPEIAFMNPELTYSVSPYQTACGIVDIMLHTFERYFTNDKNTELTDRLAEGLIIAVKNAGKAALENPNDYGARATLMWASSLSHNGLTGCGKNYSFSCHMMEHEISGMFDKVSHGAGLAVVFPAWAKYAYKYDIIKFARFATEIWGIKMEVNNPEITARKGIDATENYFKSIGMPTTFKELGITPDSFEKMANKATIKGRNVYSGIPFTSQDIVNIFNLAK